MTAHAFDSLQHGICIVSLQVEGEQHPLPDCLQGFPEDLPIWVSILISWRSFSANGQQTPPASRLSRMCNVQMSEGRALEVQRILATALRRDQATGSSLSPRSSLGTLETQARLAASDLQQACP